MQCKDGSVWGFGKNDYGQLGLNRVCSQVLKPERIATLSSDGRFTLSEIVCGRNVSIGVGRKTTGTTHSKVILGAGDNTCGQLGLPESVAHSKVFQECAVFAGMEISSVACGHTATVAHSADEIRIAGKPLGGQGRLCGPVDGREFGELLGHAGVCLAKHSLPADHMICLRSDAAEQEDLQLLLEQRYRVSTPTALEVPMPTNTFELIDVPGRNEKEDLGAAASSAQILLSMEAHIVIWVVKAGTVDESGFKETLRNLDLEDRIGVESTGFSKVLIALTHVDDMPEAEVADQIQRIVDASDGRIDKAAIHPINGKGALDQRQRSPLLKGQLAEADSHLRSQLQGISAERQTQLCTTPMQDWSHELVVSWIGCSQLPADVASKVVEAFSPQDADSDDSDSDDGDTGIAGAELVKFSAKGQFGLKKKLKQHVAKGDVGLAVEQILAGRDSYLAS